MKKLYLLALSPAHVPLPPSLSSLRLSHSLLPLLSSLSSLVSSLLFLYFLFCLFLYSFPWSKSAPESLNSCKALNTSTWKGLTTIAVSAESCPSPSTCHSLCRYRFHTLVIFFPLKFRVGISHMCSLNSAGHYF